MTDQLRKSGPLTCQVIKEGKTSQEIRASDQAGDQEGKASHGIKSEDSKKKTPVDIAGLVITGIITILARIRTVFA